MFHDKSVSQPFIPWFFPTISPMVSPHRFPPFFDQLPLPKVCLSLGCLSPASAGHCPEVGMATAGDFLLVFIEESRHKVNRWNIDDMEAIVKWCHKMVVLRFFFGKLSIKWSYPPASSILDWDFPWNKPSSELGVPPWLWKPPNHHCFLRLFLWAIVHSQKLVSWLEHQREINKHGQLQME